jgi:hypothetical protein
MAPSFSLPPSPPPSYPPFVVLLQVSRWYGPQTTPELPSSLKIRGVACKITPEEYFKSAFCQAPLPSLPTLGVSPPIYDSNPLTLKCLQPQVFFLEYPRSITSQDSAHLKVMSSRFKSCSSGFINFWGTPLIWIISRHVFAVVILRLAVRRD